MGFYADPAFFVISGLLVVPAIILGLRGKHSVTYTLAASIVMMFFLFQGDLRGAISLLLFLIVGFTLTKAVLGLFANSSSKKARLEPPSEQADSSSGTITKASFFVKHRIGLFRVLLALSIVPLAIVKISAVFDENILGFIGVSYITFKAVQILIEIRDGLITEMGIIDYLCFLLFFPVFTSGPITRSRDFLSQIKTNLDAKEYTDLLARGVLWFIKGTVYTFVLASFFEWLMWFVPSAISGGGAAFDLLKQVSYAFSYGFFLFFDFAGYSFMAMGIGACFGIEVPLNFNAPFRSIDIKDFWNRWHITLSYWLRDFVFMRLMRSVMKHKLFKSRTTGACLGYVSEMVLMGAWHGLTADYLLYGLYHGLLLMFCELFQKTSFYKKHKKQKAYQIISWAITTVAVFFGFALFSGQVLSAVTGGMQW